MYRQILCLIVDRYCVFRMDNNSSNRARLRMVHLDSQALFLDDIASGANWTTETLPVEMGWHPSSAVVTGTMHVVTHREDLSSQVMLVSEVVNPGSARLFLAIHTTLRHLGCPKSAIGL